MLRVSSGDPLQRAVERSFRTDLLRIKEAYTRLGRERFMRLIGEP